MSAASIGGRATRQLVKQVAAQMTGRSRGPDRKVLRDSYDVDDPRARVFRPVGDGTVAGARSWIDDLLQVAREYDSWAPREKGARGPLTPYGIAVLEALLRGNKLDYRTGRLEPPIAWLEKVTGFARKTVTDAMKRLKWHGFLDWVRRSQKTGRKGEAGPQREQVTNAYFFDVSRLGRGLKRVLQRFRDLRQRSRRRELNRATASPAADSPPCSSVAKVRDSALQRALDGLEAALGERESSTRSLYPR